MLNSPEIILNFGEGILVSRWYLLFPEKPKRLSFMSNPEQARHVNNAGSKTVAIWILFCTVCFQGIFPVWTRRRKRREKDLIRI